LPSSIRQKQDLLRLYFEQSETESSKFTPGQFLDITPVGFSSEGRTDGYTDPVYVFMARKIVSGLVNIDKDSQVVGPDL